jgi:asparagine synthase (glutamine-hydrolysing)
MCGIVGVASSTRRIEGALVERMRDTMTHRGPDACGLWANGNGIAFGHRRLSIVDLSPGGAQPMVDRTGSLHVTFNGEIYNWRALRSELAALGHSFHTSSDTEVLLAAYRQWGYESLEHLNGMFAFAIHDGTRNTVFLARDRAGEKPLFYIHRAGELAFASELKALMADDGCDRRYDVAALDSYLAFGYVPGEACMLAGARKLPPAHAMVYDVASDRLRVWRYWQLPQSSTAGADAQALLERLDALLEDAVRLQLEADVPVGVLLSGGVDSSLVTAYAARVSSRPVRTFTIAFPGHGSYDEAPYARLVASHFGTEHTELEAEAATVDLLPMLARQYDEPMADSSMVPTFLVSRLIRQSATVALGGDGGDELFGGYSLYSWVIRQQRLQRFIPWIVRRAIAFGARGLPIGFRGRTYLGNMATEQRMAIAQTGLYLDEHTRATLTPGLLRAAGLKPERHRTAAAAAAVTVLQQLTSADFQTYLPDDILVKVARASMLASLEVRAPFLDHRIISFAFGEVPDTLRGTERARKVLLRMLATRLLPRELDVTRKQGFSIPLAAWFKGEWGSYIEDVLMDRASDTFDRGMVQSLIAGQRRGLNNTQRLFALMMFELWRREYQIGGPA